MAYQIINFSNFDKKVKKLSKKYQKINQDLKILHQFLQKTPSAADEIFANYYKIRLKNSSTNKGKSGGFRVIYYFIDDENNAIYLLDIYSKSEQKSVNHNYLMKLVSDENSN